MKISLKITLSLLFFLPAHATSDALIRKVDQCTPVAGAKKTVYFIKQWHLAPTTNTTDIETAKKQPQYRNQSEIYTSIADLITEKKIDTVIAEGCEGEITRDFKNSFNGWSFEKLAKETLGKSYGAILTHVPLKAEVKFGDQVKTLCGDDLSQIKLAQLALSDLRGDVGYWQRIAENEKNPAKQKIYVDGVIEMLKLPAGTDPANAMLALKKDILEAF